MSYSEFDSESEPEQPLSLLLQAIAPKLMLCRIREFEPEDLEACVEIYRSNAPDYLSEEGLEAYIEFLALGTSYYLVIEHDGEIVACGGLELIGDSDTATLVHGMVHGEYHRQGFGTTLLAARLALLECEVRPQEVWVNTTAATLPFYGRFGFAYHSSSGKRPGADEGRASVWMSVDDQDIEDIRYALEERGIKIFLNDPNEDDTEEEE
ncbi:N-acetylglutamate synthase-like GNAT family acetyltransferase [Prosthecobacter fusiformis]|uniref:N-acetylglutamate synthase-like GNAT family acetyltransferase n=1 Tax=Prosthecobacter fusiformis TaxID=48464 RepID=A0A4V3FFK8_9BACT|nr:GNAT family N-acetyltransferase [Prosthecobacter fusiformis]TDU70913.1 N-acetylglutamate synthase-like GNAT family acetyltransferase [Prosthecobacter fusiformis]